ncbi:unnamed protein product [Paramecium octaurelia]|uniref:Uncharacterized protein n=1 Tax=Paramecium octaurelia TaxID=43137 RepID=A0A8S1WZR4_PAROT|nr:unnamed protein product [Paramecium octaurelia]
MRSIREISDDIQKLIRLLEKKIRFNKEIAIKNYVRKYKKLLHEFREIEKVGELNRNWQD